MDDIIIILLIAAVVAVGIVYTVRHFQGKGGCCGGGGYKVKKKKLPKVLYTKTFKVEGMHCDHCKARVEEVINDMNGLAGKVDLKKAALTVSYGQEVGDDIIAARLQRAGYTVTGTL